MSTSTSNQPPQHGHFGDEDEKDHVVAANSITKSTAAIEHPPINGQNYHKDKGTDETSALQDIPEDGDSEKKKKKKNQEMARRRQRRIQNFVHILLILPYFLGLIWTFTHPILSILTGENKCRGWYIDENSIDTRFADSSNAVSVPSYFSHLLLAKTTNDDDSNSSSSSSKDADGSLCDAIRHSSDGNHSGQIKRETLVQCLHHDHGAFDIARVVPQSNSLDASEEAIVFVIPHPISPYKNATSTSMFHPAVVAALEKLADPRSTPWLAKTIFVVRPSQPDCTTEQTVESFLNAYSGTPPPPPPTSYQITDNPSSSLLPPSWSGAIIRNLIVIEVDDSSTTVGGPQQGRRQQQQKQLNGITHLQLKPQGRRGVLPNADLVFLAGKLMEKTSFLNKRQYPKSTFLAHGYVQEYQDATLLVDRLAVDYQSWIRKQQPNPAIHKLLDTRRINAIKSWAIDFTNLALFARTMAIGPFPPHAPALDRGIDSLTLSISFDGGYRRDPSIELVQFTMEYMVRALSNLHERLHHSHVLYLLPSPKMFVSHMEYFLPNVLVLLPLAVRAFGLVLPKLKGGIDLTVVGMSLVMSLVAMLTVGNPDDDNANDKISAALRFLYIAAGLFWIRHLKSFEKEKNESSMKQQQQYQEDNGGDDIKPKELEEVDDVHGDQKENGQEDTESATDAAKSRMIRSLQFVSCVLGAYIFVPIAFAHTSLSYIPSLIWSPLLAFPDYSRMNQTALAQLKSLILVVVVVATAPPLLLVPAIFDKYTPFVKYAYVPLHLHYFVLVLLSILR